MATRKTKGTLTGHLGQAINALAESFSQLPTPAMLIGGIAVIARGVPRATRDVDATIALGELTLSALVGVFQQHNIEPRIDAALEFAEAHQILLLRHQPSGVDIDLSLAWLPFEMDALDAAEQIDLGGTTVPIARSEDLVIYKAVAFRPQDQQDIERLVSLHNKEIDFARVRRVVGEFAEALDEPERLRELDKILKRAK